MYAYIYMFYLLTNENSDFYRGKCYDMHLLLYPRFLTQFCSILYDEYRNVMHDRGNIRRILSSFEIKFIELKIFDEISN